MAAERYRPDHRPVCEGRSKTRRRFLQLAGTATTIGFAGCSGDNGGGEQVEPVPEEYETAVSIGGIERDPAEVAPKDVVGYQSEPNDGQQCSDCRYYIQDKNGDDLGACAIVEGTIKSDGWCSSFAPDE